MLLILILFLILIIFWFVAAPARVTKNPQPLPAVGFVKSVRSTSANGIAGYDDYQNDSLRHVFQHYSVNVIKFRAPSSAKSTGFYAVS